MFSFIILKTKFSTTSCSATSPFLVVTIISELSKENSMPSDMCAASNDANKKHLDFQVATFLESELKEYTTNSVTYKPGTVILEESQQLEFAKRLAEEGINVTINESPTVVEELKSLYGDLFNYG